MDRQEWEQLVRERKETHRRNVADSVRFYRLLGRMTMRDLASASGCSLDTIYRVEHEKGDTRLDTEVRLAAALGVEWGDLIRESLPQRPEEVSYVEEQPRRPAAVGRVQNASVPTSEPSDGSNRAERRRKRRKK